MVEAISGALERVRGSYALVVMNVNDEGKLYLAKKGSPLVVGFGEGENFVASDIPALLPYTNRVAFFEDGDLGVMTSSTLEVFENGKESVNRPAQRIPWNPLMAEKGGFKHFMQKEIFEQSRVLEDALAGRINHSDEVVDLREISELFDGEGAKPYEEVVIVACGTSLHAGMVGKYLIESMSRIPVTVDYGSEFRYRTPIIGKKTLIVPISQSGETADTLAAVRQAADDGAKILSICNVVGSSIPRASGASLYTHAGPEIGVASTKAFTSQLIVLLLLALELGRRTGRVKPALMKEAIDGMAQLPRLLNWILDRSKQVRTIADHYAAAQHALYIGRGVNYPVALEGALKLKEISYIHAEGFPAGELKHGPIALIDDGVPVVALATRDATYEKVLSNIEEVRARGASVIAIATKGDEDIKAKADEVIYIPETPWYLTPITAVVPLQLLAYYVADHKGTDVDQPRNLAKSVTVE
jgi:glucosamine--fructose-6-phosphate aminotransferase (isomerizing)